MNTTEEKSVKLACPRCKKTELTTLDADEPPDAVLIEVACPACLEIDDSLTIEPVFKDKHGLRLRR